MGSVRYMLLCVDGCTTRIRPIFFIKFMDDKSTTMMAWERLRNIFQDNKGTRVVHLENQFGNIHLSQFSSLGDYCQSLKIISTQLAALDHPISEERLVLQLVGKLSSDNRMVSTLFQQSTPLPSYDKAYSMLELVLVSCEKSEPLSSSLDTEFLISVHVIFTANAGWFRWSSEWLLQAKW